MALGNYLTVIKTTAVVPHKDILQDQHDYIF